MSRRAALRVLWAIAVPPASRSVRAQGALGGRRLSRILRVGYLTVCVGAAAAACRGSEGGGRHPGAQQRKIAVERWDTLWMVGGPRDSTLLNPFLLAASDSLVFVYDGAARRVVAISTRDGSVAWRFGRMGSGPDEFRGVRDLKVVRGLGVAVLDPRNNRITVLDARGGVRARVPLDRVGHAEQLAPLSGGRFVLLTMAADTPFVVVDRAGRALRHTKMPWPGYARLDPLARQGLIAADGARTWAFGFSMGDGWVRYDGVSPASGLIRYVEHTEFPRVENQQEGGQFSSRIAAYQACSACSMYIEGATLHVHFGGHDDPRRIADLYDLATGRYLSSERLPVEATAVEGTPGRRYVLAADPFPILLALKPARRVETAPSSP